MLESLTGFAVLAVVAVLVFYGITRRASLTPEQRHIEDLQRKTRKLEREQRRERWN